MWCYQYTGTIMIQSFGTLYMKPPHSIPVIYIEILLFGNLPHSLFRTGKIKLNPQINLIF